MRRPAGVTRGSYNICDYIIDMFSRTASLELRGQNFNQRCGASEEERAADLVLRGVPSPPLPLRPSSGSYAAIPHASETSFSVVPRVY